MKRIKYLLIWAAITFVVGAIGSYIFNLNFWVSSSIIGVSLIINGLIAEWEERNL